MDAQTSALSFNNRSYAIPDIRAAIASCFYHGLGSVVVAKNELYPMAKLSSFSVKMDKLNLVQWMVMKIKCAEASDGIANNIIMEHAGEEERNNT